MPTAEHIQTGPLRACIVAAVTALAAVSLTACATASPRPTSAADRLALTIPSGVRTWKIAYRAHDGTLRNAYVLLPSWYGPDRNPSIPLVISPHGRGLDGLGNSHLWGNLPALGNFAVVNPDGEGDHLRRFSWGATGQIDDLARMPQLVSAALPWLRVDRRRVYALGGSMGGQETLLLVARHPEILAGAAAVDSLVDFPRQYRNFPRLQCNAVCRRHWNGPLGDALQRLARHEVGGTPASAPAAYAARSPLALAPEIAQSCVPLQIWWSRTDRIVVDSQLQSGLLFERVRKLNPSAPVEEYVGDWAHTAIMQAGSLLPTMLARFGLMPSAPGSGMIVLDVNSAPSTSSACHRGEA